MSTAAILGCAGERLSADERALFAETRPAGFILFRHNCADPAQVRDLVADVRDCVGDPAAPVMIDQEGGRVTRLPSPPWRHPPPAATFGTLAQTDPTAACRAVWRNARLIAAELADLGITVNTLPVLDLPTTTADPAIGDRAFGADPGRAAALGRAVSDGLLAGGVAPVMKHLPGHGRARADSHHTLPVVDAPWADLAAHDLRPFVELADLPWAMTAHVAYTAMDAGVPATTSAAVIRTAIREHMGVDGVLVSDDLGMAALGGTMRERGGAAIAAGCDLVLACSRDLEDRRAALDGAGELSEATAARLASAETRRRREADGGVDRAALRDVLEADLGAV